MLTEELSSAYITPDWFKVRTSDPNLEASLRVAKELVPQEIGSKTMSRKQVYIGKATRNIEAPSYIIANRLWDLMDEERFPPPEDQGEGSIIEEINEHHRILSSTKTFRKFFRPREFVLRFVWKEVSPRAYIMGR